MAINEHTIVQLLNILYQVASELHQLTDPQKVTAREWLSYNEALTQVQQAIIALEKLKTPPFSTDTPQPQPKKSLMAQLKEIKIDGEPDWSQRCNGEIL